MADAALNIRREHRTLRETSNLLRATKAWQGGQWWGRGSMERRMPEGNRLENWGEVIHGLSAPEPPVGPQPLAPCLSSPIPPPLLSCCDHLYFPPTRFFLTLIFHEYMIILFSIPSLFMVVLIGQLPEGQTFKRSTKYKSPRNCGLLISGRVLVVRGNFNWERIQTFVLCCFFVVFLWTPYLEQGVGYQRESQIKRRSKHLSQPAGLLTTY